MINVLVIEDDHIMLKAITNILGKKGYNVIVAQNGKEAFDLVDTADYDVVITDLMIPYANGLEIVTRIRKSHTKKEAGIIVVSSMTDEDMVNEAFNLGADDYLRKPIMATELVARIKRLTSRAGEATEVVTKMKAAAEYDIPGGVQQLVAVAQKTDVTATTGAAGDDKINPQDLATELEAMRRQEMDRLGRKNVQ